jgi:WhiB family redox-sensing transcriptional regulator
VPVNPSEFKRAWRDAAVCAGMDPDLFFPPRHQNVDERAEAACRVCPVSGPCLDWALRHERDGFWAGTTVKRRQVLRRTLGVQLIEPAPASTLLSALSTAEDLTA